MINEDILELMMCSLPLNDEEIAQDILRRSQSAWDALPDFVKHAHDGQSTIGGGDLDLISLDFRLNDFLLHRVLVRKQRANSDELIRISMDLVTRVIQLIRRHHSTTFTTDLPWIVSRATCEMGKFCLTVSNTDEEKHHFVDRQIRPSTDRRSLYRTSTTKPRSPGERDLQSIRGDPKLE